MNKYVGAIDQGTTSTRFIVFDRTGATIASAQMDTGRSSRSPAGWSTIRPKSGATPRQ